MSYIKSLRMLPSRWNQLSEQLKKDYPVSTWLIRDKMRRELGFVYRRHTEWHADADDAPGVRTRPKVYIYLDFYNEPQQIMFLLKYGEYFNS